MRVGVRLAVIAIITTTVACATPCPAYTFTDPAISGCGSSGGWLLPSTANFPVRTPGWLTSGPMAVTSDGVWFGETRDRLHKTLSRVVAVSSADGTVHRSRSLTNQFFAGYGAASAWFNQPSTGNWTALNPSTGARVARFRPAQLVADSDLYGGLWGYSVAAAKNLVWFLGRTGQGIAVSQVNLGSRAVDWTRLLPGAGELPAGTGAGSAIGASEGDATSPTRVLVALPASTKDTNSLWSLDSDGAVLAQTSYPVPADGLRDTFVAVNGSNAYVVQYRSDYGQSTLTRYDPGSLAAGATRHFFFPFTTAVTNTAVWMVAEERDDGCLALRLHRMDPIELSDETSPMTVQTTVIGASDTGVWTLDGDGTRAPAYAPARLTKHVL